MYEQYNVPKLTCVAVFQDHFAGLSFANNTQTALPEERITQVAPFGCSEALIMSPLGSYWKQELTGSRAQLFAGVSCRLSICRGSVKS